MKKSSATGAKASPPVKSATLRSGASRQRSSHRDPAASDRVRLEVAAPSPPAVIEPTPARATNELRRVRFGYFKPEARDVHLVGSFNGWEPRTTPMIRDSLGDWSVEIELPTGEHRYRFVVDGELRDDPLAQQTARNAFGGFDAIMVVV